MFRLHCFQRKTKQTPVEVFVADEEEQHSNPQRSVALPDSPAATVAPVSAKSVEAGKKKKKNKKNKRRRWRNRLFGDLESKKTEEKPSLPQENDVTSDDTAKKTSWWDLLFKCCRRRHRVSPATSPVPRTSCSPKRHSGSLTPQDEVMLFSELDLSNKIYDYDDFLLPEVPSYPTIMEQIILEMWLKEQFDNTTRSHVSLHDGVKESTITTNNFGFPNIGQSCYMNSSLQSLLTLEDFVRDISCQERVWGSVSAAQVMRRLMDIRDAHTSTDAATKCHLLRLFKEAVSVQAPEFSDRQQKDAHEFLSAVLDQMRSLSPLLQEHAAGMGRRYTCPVEDHLVFRMENTRTCKRCGVHSTRQEEFTNLSLDLVPGGSVDDMLQNYLMETELEFRCECGGQTSGQRSTFATLPKVLILHLKRFRFTPFYELRKADDPVGLQRDLVVSSEKDVGCYSLVSTISHFGSIRAGHYICDGIHPDDSPDEPTDRWLTFNDSAVSETTGWSTCEKRQRTAYILFYRRQE
ncbi:ubiquitin carboxyl-terminal hydrolase 37 [Lates calcarifer]|uniref:Ubiquitin carboxyl-terminal hydrolase n=1 Tax=Lates calcarifer TaxID=8187 RepID=A0AAJ7PFU4_LATCA|nr:ubiquitin carboxyl-terminal hydrolase 37 [Lates calcarifer]